ncbi:MAG TPA: family 16 glycoside hydrolase, partial [Phycisphaerae bacterium]|nr:family 16 glycoside hydrolase [Phycisphaerae bacterium]
HVTMKINGTTTVDYTEPEPAEKVARSGVIAVQIHGGGPLEVQFRNIRIQEVKDATCPRDAQ